MLPESLFKLAKLTIEAFKDPGRSRSLSGVDNKDIPPGAKMEVQFNPETLRLRHEGAYSELPGVGVSSLQRPWSASHPRTLDIKLVFDGTGVDASGFELLSSPPTVAERVAAFRSLCADYVGTIHEPPYLRLTWDKGVLGDGPQGHFDCRLKSFDVTYTSFGRDASPLRAELQASFFKDRPPSEREKNDNTTSPDLTHRRLVTAGDTLPMLCREIYGSAEHYLRVAEANGLDDLRGLPPGQELSFPPFARRRG